MFSIVRAIFYLQNINFHFIQMTPIHCPFSLILSTAYTHVQWSTQIWYGIVIFDLALFDFHLKKKWTASSFAINLIDDLLIQELLRFK